jgi:hypothetical protein
MHSAADDKRVEAATMNHSKEIYAIRVIAILGMGTMVRGQKATAGGVGSTATILIKYVHP